MSTRRKPTPGKPAAGRAGPAPVAVEDASPSLIAKLGAELRAILLWIAAAGAAVAVVWGMFSAFGSWRSAQDAMRAELTAVSARMAEVARIATDVAALGHRLTALEAIRPEVLQLRQQTEENRTAIATAGSVRNQQIEGLRDAVRLLQQGDAQQAAQTTQVLQQLSAQTAQMAALSQQIADLKAQLNRGTLYVPPAQRQGAPPEEPAAWVPLHVGS